LKDDLFSKVKEPPKGGSAFVKWTEVGQKLLIDPITDVSVRQASFRDEPTTVITGKNAEAGRLVKVDCSTADLKELAIIEPLKPGGRLALHYLRDEDTGGPQPRKRIGWAYEPPDDGGVTAAPSGSDEPSDVNYVDTETKQGTPL
jgi:hypothetical protein